MQKIDLYNLSQTSYKELLKEEYWPEYLSQHDRIMWGMENAYFQLSYLVAFKNIFWHKEFGIPCKPYLDRHYQNHFSVLVTETWKTAFGTKPDETTLMNFKNEVIRHLNDEHSKEVSEIVNTKWKQHKKARVDFNNLITKYRHHAFAHNLQDKDILGSQIELFPYYEGLNVLSVLFQLLSFGMAEEYELTQKNWNYPKMNDMGIPLFQEEFKKFVEINTRIIRCSLLLSDGVSSVDATFPFPEGVSLGGIDMSLLRSEISKIK